MRSDNELLMSLLGGSLRGCPGGLTAESMAQRQESIMDQYKAIEARRQIDEAYQADLRKKSRVMPHRPLQGRFGDYLTTLTEGDDRVKSQSRD